MTVPAPEGPIRFEPAGADDAVLLRTMVGLAIHVPAGSELIDDAELDRPPLMGYHVDFGRRHGDLGLVALEGDRPIGACWCRLFTADEPGFGWVADTIPELTVAVVADHRGRGLGTRLIEAVLRSARERDVELVSLSVDPDNPAVRLYERLGFEHVGWQDTSMTMVANTDTA